MVKRLHRVRAGGGGGGGALGVLLLLVANGANKALNRGGLVVSDSK
jgi:hypothetical protein